MRNERRRRIRHCLLCLTAPLAGGAWAADAPIYSCVDANGKKLTSDRPIPECATREQKLHNADGSLRKIVPPTPTADERAEAEAAERAPPAERAARQEAVRRDRNLVLRYPERGRAPARPRGCAGRRAQGGAHLGGPPAEARRRTQASARRGRVLRRRALPAKLRQALDANDASVEAQRVLVQNQQAEVARINAAFDVELDRLKRLWAGAMPGSMGPLGPRRRRLPSRRRHARPRRDRVSRVSSSAAR